MPKNVWHLRVVSLKFKLYKIFDMILSIVTTDYQNQSSLYVYSRLGSWLSQFQAKGIRRRTNKNTNKQHNSEINGQNNHLCIILLINIVISTNIFQLLFKKSFDNHSNKFFSVHFFKCHDRMNAMKNILKSYL